jgi:tRNA(His) guanylyltransferase
MSTGDRTSLGDRMKGYEHVTRTSLTRRMPAIIRVDGKAFHTLTSGMARPFDANFTACMWAAAVRLCEEIQGAQIAFTQSDEINVLLVDYQTLDTQPWFDAGVQKMCSVSASVATQAFGETFRARFPASMARPLFDSRVFNLPREEVVNYFVWRQQDATRNSIQMVGQAHFSQKQLHGLSCDLIQEKLFQEKGVNWNDTPVCFKRGACAVRQTFEVDGAERSHWTIREQPPIFTQDRSFIERYVHPDSDI